MVIHSNEPETAWNAVRLGNFARKAGDEVKMFIVGPGVEIEGKSTDKFPIQRDLQAFADAGERLRPALELCAHALVLLARQLPGRVAAV